MQPEDRLKVSQIPEAFMRPPIWVSPDTELLPLLDEFISGRLHLALVTEQLHEVCCVYSRYCNLLCDSFRCAVC